MQCGSLRLRTSRYLKKCKKNEPQKQGVVVEHRRTRETRTKKMTLNLGFTSLFEVLVYFQSDEVVNNRFSIEENAWMSAIGTKCLFDYKNRGYVMEDRAGYTRWWYSRLHRLMPWAGRSKGGGKRNCRGNKDACVHPWL